MVLDRRQFALLLSTTASAWSQKVEGVTGTRIRVEVFSDFQCPACKQLHLSTLQSLRNDYVSAGKVQIVHREFPLPMHKYARQAACLACASDKIGQYRKVSDALFRDQEIWSVNGSLDQTLGKVLTPAELTRLNALAKDPKVIAEVEADVELGKKLPVGQTPTMLITHKGRSQPIAGAIGYPIFRRYIDMLLATP